MTTNDRAMTAPTPEQMRALADRAEILQEDSDYDYVFVTNVMVALRDAADQLEAVQDRERISSAVGEVLFNVSNYPPAVSYRLLGLDIGPLRRKVTDAVLAIRTADLRFEDERFSDD